MLASEYSTRPASMNSGGADYPNSTSDILENVFHTTTWLKVLRIVFISAVLIFTTIGNGLVLWALKRFMSLRKPGHICLGGLAFADLCMIIPLLLRITHILTRNKTVCVSQGVTEVVFVGCVSLHLACISVERFISIKFALRYDALVTNKKVYISIASLWLVSLLAAFFIPLAISPGHFESLADGVMTLCSLNMDYTFSKMPPIVFGYAVFMLCFFFCLPCAIIMFSYTYILITSCRQRHKIMKVVNEDESRWNSVTKRLLKDLKAAKKVFLIQVLFILTYFPYFAVSVVRMEKDHKENERKLLYTSKTLSLLTCLTSCLNPVIYVSGNEYFKNAFKKLLRIQNSSGMND